MMAKSFSISKTLSTSITLFLLIQLTAGVFLFVPKSQEVKADGESWYNSSWLYRKPITVDNTSGTNTLTNYQVQVSVTHDSGMQSDFDDIRFTDSDGTTLLDYWLETSTTSVSAIFWVEVPSIAASSTATIYMYYGNSSATSTSNGIATFEERGFDDFESYNTGSPADQARSYGSWNEYASNPILATSVKDGFQSVIKVGDTYHMYYSWDNINHATSSNGKNWTVDTANNPVVTNAGVPRVWKEGDIWYMFYRSGTPKTINLATSSDGITWVKYAGNPVLTEDSWSGGAEPNGIIKIDDTYYMFYSGWTVPRKTNLATSTDLINWDKYTDNPIFNSGRFCGDIFKYGSYYYYLVPHFTWSSNYSQIELWRDTSPTFADKEFVRIVAQFGINGAWNDTDQDTPSVLTDDIFRNSFESAGNQLWMYYAGSPDNVAWYTGMTIEPDIDTALTKVIEPTIWDKYGGTVNIVDSPVRQGGRTANQSDTLSSAQATFYTDSFGPKAKGVIGTWMQRNNIINGGWYISLYSKTTQRAYLGFGLSKFRYWDGTAHNTVVDYTANTWYLITAEFDTDIDQYNFAVYDTALNEVLRLDGLSLGGGNGTKIDNIIFTSDVTNVMEGYIDDFRIRQYTSSEPSASLGSEEAIPTVPTNILPTVLSSNSIRWNFTDNSDNETGFRVYTNADVIATSSAIANLTYLDEIGLSENTQYTRYVKAYNSYGESASSSATSTYTLADTPTGFGFMRHSSSLDIYVDSFPNSNFGSSGYLFWRTDNSAYNSGWVQTNNWQDPNMVEGQTYTYAVKYRNGDGIETATTTLSGVSFIRSGGGTLIIQPQTTTTLGNTTSTIQVTSTINNLSVTSTQATSTISFEKPISQMSQDEIKAKITQITQLIAQLQSLLGKTQPIANSSSAIPEAFSFKDTLKQGVTNTAVKYLQIILNQDSETKVAQTGVGSPGKETSYFGPLTKQAVVRFQEKYRDEVLKPWGFSKGTGFVGSTTRSKLNKQLLINQEALP